MMLTSYPPIIDSGARLYSELSESLRDMGHTVTVIAEHPADGRLVDKNHKYFTQGDSKKLSNNETILRVSPLTFMSKIPGGKAVRFWLSCLLFALRGIFTRRPDVILIYSPPLYMGISGYIVSKVRRTKYVFNLQDIHPKVLFDSGVIRNTIVKKILSKMEEICYKTSHSLIAYSEGNKKHIVRRGTDERKVFVVPNWADIDRVVSYDASRSLRNDAATRDKFVVSYAGTMQQAQGLEIVVNAAELLKEYDDIIFLLAGEGVSKPVLDRMIREKGMINVSLRPVMSAEHYKQFLSESDVCLITLSAETPVETVPGKLADIMGFGKPIILVASPGGDAAQIIRKAGCGFCVEPGDTKAFSEAVLNIYRDEKLREEMRRNSRHYAEKNFARSICTKRFEEVLLSAARGIKPHASCHS
jgi:glycosyltransferase involved in cell wall biosynthesis